MHTTTYQILATNEVHHFKDGLWIPTKWRIQMAFCKTSISCIPIGTIHFSSSIVKRSLILPTNEVRSRYKDEHWFPIKWKLQMVFSWNKCLNIVYSSGNFPVFLICHEKKKQNSCHKGWTFIPNKMKGSNGFFAKQMPQYHVS